MAMMMIPSQSYSYSSIVSLYFFFLFSLVLHTLASPTFHHCRHSQRDALLEFKFHVDDLNSSPSLSSWNKSRDCCSWKGVTCDVKSGKFINLAQNNLDGPIPELISQYHNLEELHLSFNNLNGSIPKSLSKLFKLEYFCLTNNNMEGEVPSWIWRLTMVALSNNSFNNFGTSSQVVDETQIKCEDSLDETEGYESVRETMECFRVSASIPKLCFFSNSRNSSTSRHFIIPSCRERSREDQLSTSSSPYSILGVEPNCSPLEIKAAFRAKVKQYHPDVNRQGSSSDVMIRRIIQAYEMLTNSSRAEIIIEVECLDPFDHPECEALDVFVNEVLCFGKRCSYPCFKTASHVFSCDSTGTARAMSQGHGEDYRVQSAVNLCPRNCIHYVTPSQRIILEELLDSILDKPYDCSAEAELLYALIVKAQFENNRYMKPKKKQPESSSKHVDWL
ncbi:unnamed protein product [Eruca vesicaria subsp. sativa]|uniref:J domain-containing protein n=1 Tax=Eruca vesicaria subsp. sativa TaxID=29727 RepID=A0ABC8LQR0_ERUVS|nr:unnamed protein product [Eruca vesicaria subsp. sativa]